MVKVSGNGAGAEAKQLTEMLQESRGKQKYLQVFPLSDTK